MSQKRVTDTACEKSPALLQYERLDALCAEARRVQTFLLEELQRARDVLREDRDQCSHKWVEQGYRLRRRHDHEERIVDFQCVHCGLEREVDSHVSR